MSVKQSPVITPLKDGPLKVENPKTIFLDGQPQKTAESIFLCRCGQSENKPYCDGSHAKSGFTDARESNPDDKRLTFNMSSKLTIYENTAICSHAAFCLKGTPDQWTSDANGEPLTEDKLISMVQACPSGALSYALGGEEFRDQTRDPKIRIDQNTPIMIEGGIELKNTEWGEGASKEHYALCRCGASKMKPFCDGSHSEIFKHE